MNAIAWIMQMRPNAPPVISRRASATGASKLWLCATTIATPASRAAAHIVAHSASVSAIGFSTSTCRRCAAARQTCAAWC